MKASELRIGNYISFINKDNEINIPQTHPLKVMDISLFKIEVCQIDELFAQVEKPIILDNRYVCGIPLTEEWLLKFGFEKRIDGYFKSKIKLDFNSNGIVRFHWSQKVTYLDYVNQLQNLYFALTQKELSI